MSPELPFKSFDPSQLATLEKAFKAAWAVLKPKKMVAGSSQEKAQKLALAGFIATLAKDGVTDPHDLKQRAIELMVIGPA
jgi:hypothetical protein